MRFSTFLENPLVSRVNRRLLYTFEPGRIIRLLHGMVKKQDRIPADVLAKMRGYQKDARDRLKKAKIEQKR